MLVLTIVAALAFAPQDDSAAIATKMFAAFNRHDAAAMVELYDRDLRLTSSDFCSPRGKKDVLRTYQALFDALPDIEDHVNLIVAEDDRVAVRFIATSKATNFRIPIATFLRVRNGKIVEDDSYFDTGGKPCEE